MRITIIVAVLCLYYFMFVAACTRHAVSVVPPSLVRANYTIQQEPGVPGSYLVWVRHGTAADLAAAKKEIGCGLCTEETAGYVVWIKRVPKAH